MCVRRKPPMSNRIPALQPNTGSGVICLKMRSEFPVIRYPFHRSEFELQSDLYQRLKRDGMDVRGEVPSRYSGAKSCFDLVVFLNRHAVCLIEVKDSPHDLVVIKRHTRQARKYSLYDIPLFYFTPTIPIETVVSQVKGVIDSMLS